MSAPVDARPRSARWVALGVGVVLVAFVALLASRDPAPSGRASTLLGKPVPALTGTTLEGEPFDLDRWRGRWVVVNFFATWCTPCRVEHPELVAFSERHAATGDAAVVSVAFEDSDAALREFFAAEGGDWPVLVGNTGQAAISYGVTGVPESYVVSPDGIVVAAFQGVTAAQLDAVIGAGGGS